MQNRMSLLENMPSDLLENILVQLPPEDLIGKKARWMQHTNDDERLSIAEKFLLTGSKGLISKTTQAQFFQRIWRQKYKQHFPHSYRLIDQSINANLNHPKTTFNWEHAFLAYYNKIMDMQTLDCPEEEKLAILHFFSVIKESKLKQVSNHLKATANIKELKDLLEKYKDDLNFSPLDWAIMKGPETQDAKAILDYIYEQANLHLKQPHNEEKLLVWAILCCQPSEIIEQLLQEELAANPATSSTAKMAYLSLEAAVRTDNVTLIKTLANIYLGTADDVWLNSRARVAETFQLLFLATKHGHHNVLKVVFEAWKLSSPEWESIISKALNEEINEEARYCIFSLAVQYGHIEAANILISNGANPNRIDSIRKSYPIHEAIFNNHTEMVTLLLSQKSESIIQTSYQIGTPLGELALRVMRPHYFSRLLPTGVTLPALRESRLTMINLLISLLGNGKDLSYQTPYCHGISQHQFDLVLLEAKITAKLDQANTNKFNLFNSQLDASPLYKQKDMLNKLLDLTLETPQISNKALVPYHDLLMEDDGLRQEIQKIFPTLNIRLLTKDYAPA